MEASLDHSFFDDTPRDMTTLPLDIYEAIFSFFSSYSIHFSLSRVCRLFRVLIKEGHLHCASRAFFQSPSTNGFSWQPHSPHPDPLLNDFTIHHRLVPIASSLRSLHLELHSAPFDENSGRFPLNSTSFVSDFSLFLLLESLDSSIIESIILEGCVISNIGQILSGLDHKTSLREFSLRRSEIVISHDNDDAISLTLPCLEIIEVDLVGWICGRRGRRDENSVRSVCRILEWFRDCEMVRSLILSGELESGRMASITSNWRNLESIRCIDVFDTSLRFDAWSPGDNSYVKDPLVGFSSMSLKEFVAPRRYFGIRFRHLFRNFRTDVIRNPVTLLDRFPALRVLDLISSGLDLDYINVLFANSSSSNTSPHYPNLRTLRFNGRNLSNGVLLTIASRCPFLETVKILRSRNVSLETLISFVQSLTETLRVLLLPFCRNFSCFEFVSFLVSRESSCVLEEVLLNCTLLPHRGLLDSFERIQIRFHGDGRRGRERMVEEEEDSLLLCACCGERQEEEEDEGFISSHLQHLRQCPKNLIICPFCRADVLFCGLESHRAICLRRTVHDFQSFWFCHLCGQAGLSSNNSIGRAVGLSNHLQTDCPKYLVYCHRCDQEIEFSDWENHTELCVGELGTDVVKLMDREQWLPFRSGLKTHFSIEVESGLVCEERVFGDEGRSVEEEDRESVNRNRSFGVTVHHAFDDEEIEVNLLDLGVDGELTRMPLGCRSIKQAFMVSSSPPLLCTVISPDDSVVLYDLCEESPSTTTLHFDLGAELIYAGEHEEDSWCLWKTNQTMHATRFSMAGLLSTSCEIGSLSDGCISACSHPSGFVLLHHAESVINETSIQFLDLTKPTPVIGETVLQQQQPVGMNSVSYLESLDSVLLWSRQNVPHSREWNLWICPRNDAESYCIRMPLPVRALRTTISFQVGFPKGNDHFVVVDTGSFVSLLDLRNPSLPVVEDWRSFGGPFIAHESGSGLLTGFERREGGRRVVWVC